jgi:hypothetical protein
VILVAWSCSVYDASLLGNDRPSVGGASPDVGHAGRVGDGGAKAGRGGAAGKPGGEGGANDESSGDAGMLDSAGAPHAGGQSSEGGTAGADGTTAGGTAGSATAGDGTTGSGSSGGSGGSGGSRPANGGAAGGSGTGGNASAMGCAKLKVPIDDANDKAHFVVSFPSAIDLSASNAIVSMRLYVQAGLGGTIFNYVQDSQFHFFGVTTAMRPTLSGISGWQTLNFSVGAQAAGSSGIVKTDIRHIGIEINAMPSTVWSNPTIVYVDSITVPTRALSVPFNAASSVNTTPTDSAVAGQVMWQHTDSTANGTTLSWQATCP